MNSTAAVALSFVSLVAAGTAIYLVKQPAEPATAPTQTAPVDLSEFEDELSELHAEIRTLKHRLDAVEARPRPSAPSESALQAPPSEAAKAAWSAQKLKENEALTQAVEAVLEEKEIAQREAKRAKQSAGMRDWVTKQTAKLPALYQRIGQKMNLTPVRRREVEAIIDGTFTRMTELSDELQADPPPTEEDSYAIMGEIKSSVGTMVEELDEVLNDDELLELGEITAEELPRVGWVIMEEAKSGMLMCSVVPCGTDGTEMNVPPSFFVCQFFNRFSHEMRQKQMQRKTGSHFGKDQPCIHM